MPAAHWKASIFYGDNSFDMNRERTQDFPENQETEAKDWIEVCMEGDWEFTQDGVQITIPSTVINHARLVFIEETPEE